MQDLVKREAWFMSTGLDQLKHIVVLMMENRSFDHMLGSLKAIDSRIDGVTDQLSNPDTTGASVKPQPLAEFQGQLNPDPDHHFPAVDLQIFGGDASPTRAPNIDRKSTRLNSSHRCISYAVFCLKKKKINNDILFVAGASRRRDFRPLILAHTSAVIDDAHELDDLATQHLRGLVPSFRVAALARA